MSSLLLRFGVRRQRLGALHRAVGIEPSAAIRTAVLVVIELHPDQSAAFEIVPRVEDEVAVGIDGEHVQAGRLVGQAFHAGVEV